MPTSGSRRAAREHVVEVHHRLAHAHEHEVVDGLDAAEVQHLVEDLARGQVAAELHRAGGAERAGQRAAGLRGDADRAAAVAVAHQHGLDGAAVVGVEERLDGAVGAVRLVDELERGERHLGGQPLAQRGGQVGHLVVAARAVGRPAPHLAGAEGGLAGGGERVVEQLRGPPAYRGRHACASPSTSPTPAWPRAAPPSRSSSTAASRSRGEVVRDPARDVDGSEGIEVDGRPARAWKGDRAVYAVNKPAGVVSTAADTHGRPTVVELVPSGRRLYPVGPARRRHDRADPAHRRRPARAPAHASLLRGPARLPRQGAPRARARRRAAGAARRRRARRRHDRAGARQAARPRPDRDHDPRGPQAPGAADVRGGRASGRLAGARRVRPARPARASSRASTAA